MKQALFAALLFLSVTVAATPVGPMNYQGRLLDNAGIPVTGSHDFVVKIYNDPAAGTLKYQETKNSVEVEDGVYSFKVGTGPKTGGDSLWDLDLWQLNLNDLYMEVVVNGETLTPRHELTSSPHAFTSTLALHANTVGYLGGQPTDNVLAAICKASKGVWLDIADKCLGYGSDFSLATMGGTAVDVATLHSDKNFTNLDLTNADVTGINFGSSTNFSGTTFKNSTVNAALIGTGSNFTGAVIDGVVWTGSLASGTYNFTNATIKNTNLNGFNFSNSNLTNFSAGELSACPATLKVNWLCREQLIGGGDYFLVGPLVNLSGGSAVTTQTLAGYSYNLHENALQGANMQYANLNDVEINVNLTGADLQYANFKRSSMVGIKIDGANFSWANFESSKLQSIYTADPWTRFGYATFRNCQISEFFHNGGTIAPGPVNTQSFTSVAFINSNLNTVHIKEITGGAFGGSTLNNFSIALFYSAVVNFSDTIFSGDIIFYNAPSTIVWNNAKFIRARVGSAHPAIISFSNHTFNNVEFYHSRLDSNFNGSDFINCKFYYTEMASNFNGTIFPGTTTSNIWWKANTRCPDNSITTGYPATCTMPSS